MIYWLRLDHEAEHELELKFIQNLLSVAVHVHDLRLPVLIQTFDV